MPAEPRSPRLAVLIDADNASLHVGDVPAKHLRRLNRAAEAFGQDAVEDKLADIMQQPAGEGFERFTYMGRFSSTAAYSDDNGQTWRVSPTVLEVQTPTLYSDGAIEPIVLQLKDGRSVDITRRLSDVSWLREARAAASGQEASVASAPRGAVAEARLDYGRGGDVRSGDDHRFFARYVDEGLRPLDPIDLRNEAVYLVEARLMNAAPRSRALRRIVARGGPSGLPRDLAEQHDYYAHGSRRR